jgi:hypothetical protein
VSSGFSRHQRSGLLVATFSAFEADLVRSLSRQIIELLHNEQAVASTDVDPLEALLDFSGPTTAPEDPVLARFFPTAYPDDDEAAGDFRRFTEGSLRDGKNQAASCVIDTLEDAGLGETPTAGVFIDVELDDQTAMLWMKAFNDIRLAIGTRLEVTDGDGDFWAALPDDDPRVHVHDIYDYLAFLQESLVNALAVRLLGSDDSDDFLT